MKAFVQNNNLFSDFYKTAACTIMLLAALLSSGCDRVLFIEDSIFPPTAFSSIATNSQVLWECSGNGIYEVTVDGHVTNSWIMENVFGLAYGESKRYLLKSLDNGTYVVCQWYDDGTVNELFNVNIIGAFRDITVIDDSIGIVDDFANVFIVSVWMGI